MKRSLASASEICAAIALLMFDLHRQRKERKLNRVTYRVIKDAVNRGVTPSEMHSLFLASLLE